MYNAKKIQEILILHIGTKQSEVQHTNTRWQWFFSFFLFRRVHTEMEEMNKKKDLMMSVNWILISRGNKKNNSYKHKIYNTYKNLKDKMKSPPKQPKSLKPVCFEAFQTFVFFKILNALEKCSYLYY